MMELTKTDIKLGKWGNSSAFRIPKSIMDLLDFKESEDYDLIVEINAEGRKRLILEEKKTEISLEERLEAFRSLDGVLKGAGDIDIKEIRKQRHEERLAKYESLD